jgi:hypothetical protein
MSAAVSRSWMETTRTASHTMLAMSNANPNAWKLSSP